MRNIILIAIYLICCFSLKAQLPPSANGKYANVMGKKIYYEESGLGMHLLLIHGFGATAAI